MKKYLMAGMAAIAFCAAFTSCTKSENVYDETRPTQDVVAKYNDAFIKTFGQPASTQDWGFGTIYGRSNTRALSDFEAGANKNRNLWAATDGKFNLLVPTPLTSGQRERVKAYFQAHPNLSWETPDMTDYFVQQVYTGNPQTKGAYSDEQYYALNGNTVVGSAHMDKLTIAGEHVFDFNGADNVNTATDVLDNGSLTNSNKFHSDQITLMIGTKPTWVGYETSEASILKNNCMALAGAKDIDDWARQQNPVIGEDVWYGKDQYGYDNSSWNRSFVGLDYEQIPASDAYATVAWDNPATKYVKVDDLQPNTIWDSKTDTYQTKDEYKAANGEYLLDKKGNKIPYISVNTNTILGTTAHFANQTDYMPQVNGIGQVFDIQKIYEKVEANCLPVADKSLQEWVKNIGGRDYVYSDWIVTLAPARPANNNNVRVIAEDLNAEAVEGDISDSDWDFNDVVFDVEFTGENSATITLVAAGGTLPLIVGVQNPVDGQSYPANEVHALYGVSTDYMVNTKAELKGLNGGDVNKKPTINVTITGVKAQNGKNIPIHVQKIVNDQPKWIELQAITGEPAAKIGVDPNSFNYCLEKVDIRGQYPLFTQWVRTASPSFWWTGNY
ncbi:MAG: hypothetical protein IJJ56_12725 [Prevotella sp.]|nr:hypothetical protein [Prevotella sp.]